MNHKRIKLSTGKIDIYDDLIPLSDSQRVYEFLVKNCGWYLGWKDNNDADVNLHASLKLGEFDFITDHLKDQEEFEERTRGMSNSMVIANLSHASGVHHKHAHQDEDIVLLYYANIKWEEHWEGETMFFSEDGEVEYTCKYKPSRVVVFDGSIPHTIRAQSVAGPQFRFSLSYFWRKES